MNARHKRKGKALPKPGRSLTAAIAARCATKTWYNERSPRRAGTTMAICAGRQSCRHKETWMDRELSPSPGRHDHGNMCGKETLPAQENMDSSGTIPPRRAGTMGKERQFPMKRQGTRLAAGYGYGIAKTKACISRGLPERSGCSWQTAKRNRHWPAAGDMKHRQALIGQARIKRDGRGNTGCISRRKEKKN